MHERGQVRGDCQDAGLQVPTQQQVRTNHLRRHLGIFGTARRSSARLQKRVRGRGRQINLQRRQPLDLLQQHQPAVPDPRVRASPGRYPVLLLLHSG